MLASHRYPLNTLLLQNNVPTALHLLLPPCMLHHVSLEILERQFWYSSSAKTKQINPKFDKGQKDCGQMYLKELTQGSTLVSAHGCCGKMAVKVCRRSALEMCHAVAPPLASQVDGHCITSCTTCPYTFLCIRGWFWIWNCLEICGTKCGIWCYNPFFVPQISTFLSIQDQVISAAAKKLWVCGWPGWHGMCMKQHRHWWYKSGIGNQILPKMSIQFCVQEKVIWAALKTYGNVANLLIVEYADMEDYLYTCTCMYCRVLD